VVQEARDVGVVEAGEQLALAREARVVGVEGELEGDEGGGRLCADGTVDGAKGAQTEALQDAPGADPGAEGKARRMEVGRQHGEAREQRCGPVREEGGYVNREREGGGECRGNGRRRG
jgi:hypothetical protein